MVGVVAQIAGFVPSVLVSTMAGMKGVAFTVAVSASEATSVGPGLNAVHVAELTVVTVMTADCVKKAEAPGIRLYGKSNKSVPRRSSTSVWRESITSPM